MSVFFWILISAAEAWGSNNTVPGDTWFCWKELHCKISWQPWCGNFLCKCETMEAPNFGEMPLSHGEARDGSWSSREARLMKYIMQSHTRSLRIVLRGTFFPIKSRYFFSGVIFLLNGYLCSFSWSANKTEEAPVPLDVTITELLKQKVCVSIIIELICFLI